MTGRGRGAYGPVASGHGPHAPLSKFKSHAAGGGALASLTVVGGRGGLAAGVAGRLRAAHVKADVRVFPDGEGKITLDSRPEKGVPAAVVHSVSPPVDSNLVRALSMIREARRFTDDVTAVVPYMGYARQDQVFLDGEVVTMEVVASLLESAGATRVVVVDIHSEKALSHFSVPAANISAVPELADHFAGMDLPEPLVVSPDAGGLERAREFARRLGAGCAVLEKERNRHTGEVRIVGSDLGETAGRDIVLVDDMISTGGSIVKAAEFLGKRGCGRIFAACTHALLVGGAGAMIGEAGVASIVGTNTIDGWGSHDGRTEVVDVAGIMAAALEAQGEG